MANFSFRLKIMNNLYLFFHAHKSLQIFHDFFQYIIKVYCIYYKLAHIGEKMY